jgi:Recombination endonuclease VII
VLTDYQLKYHYGISSQQLTDMIAEQNGCCAICHEPMNPPCIDHDHESGVVRALLCRNCNTGLGMFQDNIRLLAAAIVYLEDHKPHFS